MEFENFMEIRLTAGNLISIVLKNM